MISTQQLLFGLKTFFHYTSLKIPNAHSSPKDTGQRLFADNNGGELFFYFTTSQNPRQDANLCCIINSNL